MTAVAKRNGAKPYDPVTDRAPSIIGAPRILDDYGAAVSPREAFDDAPAAAPKRRRGRPPRNRDGVALMSAAHPTPETDDHDFGDAVETVEIELPDDVVIIDDAPAIPQRVTRLSRYAFLRALKVGGFAHILYLKADRRRPESIAGRIRAVCAKLKFSIKVCADYTYGGRKGIGVWRLK